MHNAIKYITTIIGAGAVLDFDYNYQDSIFPSSRNITDYIKNLKVQDVDNKESDVISKVYNLACDRLSQIYEKRGICKQYELNFEELYFLLESLLSYTETGIDYLNPYGRSPLSMLVCIRDELQKYYHVEYERALTKILKVIIDIIARYDNHFKEFADSEKWYRSFWQGKENIKYDIFTFNYDTTIEQSIEDYEDGFEIVDNHRDKISAFVPQKLIHNSKKQSTIQHLHGCIYYAEYPIESGMLYSHRDFFKMNYVNDTLKSIGLQQNEQTQARELYMNSPILVGLRKLDKMTYMPNSIYHANLVNALMKNRGLLIVGYSFGDLYVNQLMQRRLLMRGDDHRIVIIDSFPKSINSVIDLYRYMDDYQGKMIHFLKPFFNFQFDDNFKLTGVEFTSYNEPIYSKDHKCMLLICGFKKAVELHADLIQNFL